MRNNIEKYARTGLESQLQSPVTSLTHHGQHPATELWHDIRRSTSQAIFGQQPTTSKCGAASNYYIIFNIFIDEVWWGTNDASCKKSLSPAFGKTEHLSTSRAFEFIPPDLSWRSKLRVWSSEGTVLESYTCRNNQKRSEKDHTKNVGRDKPWEAPLLFECCLSSWVLSMLDSCFECSDSRQLWRCKGFTCSCLM